MITLSDKDIRGTNRNYVFSDDGAPNYDYMDKRGPGTTESDVVNAERAFRPWQNWPLFLFTQVFPLLEQCSWK